MNGKDICDLLKQYRKELSEKNGIDYKIKDCSHGDDCKGTCPFCEKETDELYALLREKKSKGEIVDWTTSIELPDESFVLDTDKFTDSSIEIGDIINDRISDGLCGVECSSKGLFDPDFINDDCIKTVSTKGLFDPDSVGINVDYLEPLQGDFSSIFNMPKKGYIDPDILNGDANEDDISPDENCSHMNELLGDIGYEPDCEETSVSESDKDYEVTIEKIKEVRRRTSRGLWDSKEALIKCNGDVDEAVVYLEKHPNKPLMGRISID